MAMAMAMAIAITSFATAAGSVAAEAPSLVLTIDDGPSLRPTPLLTPAERNAALLSALALHEVSAALFVTVNFGADRPEGLALARAWGAAGHRLGNHTMTHLDLDARNVSLAQYQQEVLDCDAVIQQLPGYRKWFRYTYLHEGASDYKREGMRDFLQSSGYINVAVGLDTRDWAFDPLLEAALNRDPQADLVPLKKAYLDQVWKQAQDSQQKLREQGRSAVVVLVHHNLTNALWLGDLLAMFKAKGWRFVSPELAVAQR